MDKSRPRVRARVNGYWQVGYIVETHSDGSATVEIPASMWTTAGTFQVDAKSWVDYE